MQDLNVKEAEEVTLVGTFVQEYAEELSSPARQDLQWLGESLLLVSAWCLKLRPTLPLTYRNCDAQSSCLLPATEGKSVSYMAPPTSLHNVVSLHR